MATILAEDTALGGQAGTSSRIENLLGFPPALSGEELAARAALQAQKFGVRIKLASKAVSLSSDDGVHQVRFDDGEVVTAKAVIIATGARYNRLPLDRLSEFEGVGVYYAATQMEAQACPEDRSSSWAGATRPVRPRCSWAAALPRSTSSSGDRPWPRHVAIPDRPDRARPARHGPPRTLVTALVGKDRLEGVQLLDNGSQQTRSSPPTACSSSSEPSPHRAGWRVSSPRTTMVPDHRRRPRRRRLDGAGRSRCSSKPAGLASLPSVTCAAVRSSGLRPRSGKDRWPYGSCTSVSRRPGQRSPTRPEPVAMAPDPATSPMRRPLVPGSEFTRQAPERRSSHRDSRRSYRRRARPCPRGRK